MKMKMWLGVLGGLLAGVTAAGAHAQESRQDVSVSFIGVFTPNVTGNSVHFSTTETGGFLGSYRYQVTPRSALELNYSFAQNSYKYLNVTNPNLRVHARQQEITGAYVYSRNYKNYNPFVELGVGGMIFTPILDSGTLQKDYRQNTNVGALFGGGLAYEISPSFDIRAEYRGFVLKAPDFGNPSGQTKTGRYYVVSTPAIGVAYHF